MNKNTLKTISESLISDIKSAGGNIFIVGGSVRDELLGISKDIKDLDLLVDGLDIDNLSSILLKHGSVNVVGKSFGVIKFSPIGSEEVIDISVPRIDNKTGEKHTDFTVTIGKNVTIEHDRMRRDFTINALFKDLTTGEVIDFADGRGLKDLKQRVLRMVSPNSFCEDPLRILRAVQMCSRFNLKIEKATLKNMVDNMHLLKTVSADRLIEEFKKLFFKSPKPSVGIEALISCGAAHVLFDIDSKGEVDILGMDKIKHFASFLILLLEKTIDPIQCLKKLKPSNELLVLVEEAFTFINNKDFSKAAVVILNNFKKSGPEVFDVIDELLKVKQINYSCNNILNDLKTNGIATCFKEMTINGNDLLQQGLKGPEIGKRLLELLLDGVGSRRIRPMLISL
jgi:tRNA nucleotidyltransferase/poly(A) polymerase